MIKDILKKILIPTIIIGSVGVTLLYFNLIPGELTIVSQQNTTIGNYNWSYYTLDLKKYLENLEYNINITNLPISLPAFPTIPTFPSVSNAIEGVIETLKFIAKVFITIANIIIFLFNILLMPIKLILYPVRLIITLIGMQTTRVDFIEVIETIGNFNINYIPINF